MIADLLRPAYRKLRGLRHRYAGEVGYVSRELHRIDAAIRDRQRIAQRRALVAKRPVSTPAGEIARDLDANGYHITTVDALGLDGSVIAFCREVLQKHGDLDLASVVASRDSKSKRYWTDLYQEFGEARTPVVDFLLSDIILDACSSYLGEVPILNYLSLLLTPPQGGAIAEQWRASQDWHLDNDRPRRVKVFMLPLGADDECGPTMFLPKTYSRHACYRDHYPGYFNDYQFAKAGLDPSKIGKFTGGPGAVMFIDTSVLFHCGSRTASKPRLLLNADFAPMTTYLPYRTALRSSWPESSFPKINEQIFHRFSKSG